MQFATEHLYESYLNHLEKQRKASALERRTELFALTENEEWRALNFETCGNGEAIGKSYYYLQKVLVKEDFKGEQHENFVGYAMNRYLEPDRRYMAQRKMLMQKVRNEKLNNHLERIASLAKMGERDEDKVLLALLPLWTNNVNAENIPAGLYDKINDWMENTRSSAVKKLWIKTLNK
jgi:hypothetical protein